MLKVMTVLTILVLLLPFPAVANEQRVVINAYQISGASSTDEYVEILNAGQRDINLSRWRLSKKTASGNISSLLTTFPEIHLEPGRALRIGHLNCLCSPDIRYSTSGSIAKDNTIVLYSDNGQTVVDMVGFGAASHFEGAPAKNPGDHEVHGRKNNGLDTNNNGADFHLLFAPPVSKEEAQMVLPTRTETRNVPDSSREKNQSRARLIVTEFLPNPEGADSENEFIEIKNIGLDADIGGFYIADTVGASKSYKIPSGTILRANQYLAFFSSKTPISLNNKGDGVEIWDPEKNVLNSSPDDCGRAQEGMSYSLGENGWSWTNVPTPGEPNIIALPTGAEVLGNEKANDETVVISPDELRGQNTEKRIASNENDRLFGLVLLVVAIFGAISYTLYVNKEKLIDLYHKKRTRNDGIGERIRQKIKGG